MSTVLVSGANGFVGRALCQSLASRSRDVRSAVRRAGSEIIGGQSPFVVGEIDAKTAWSPALSEVDVVVHLASRVHLMQETSSDSLSVYRMVNTEGSLNLARQAAVAGVRRFVFVSTVKVNGEGGGGIYSETDAPCPVDPYAISKWEAEQGLCDVAAATGMEVVIVRPPLVYGPGVKANFLRMMQWLNKGMPLPFGTIHNKRSLVALDNLIDLLITCIDHPAAVNQTFLVSDGEDLSTPELFVRMAAALGKPACFMPFPEQILKAGAVLLGKRALSQRLFGSLQVDISKAKNLLGWSPPVSVNEGLQLTAKHFLADTLEL